MEATEWKEIPNFNGRYKINVNSAVFDNKNNRFINPHLMGVPRANYLQVTLYKKDGNSPTTKHTKRVHALMAITFLNHTYGNRKIVVDHIDSDKHNNHLSNLRIVSMKENNNKERKIKSSNTVD